MSVFASNCAHRSPLRLFCVLLALLAAGLTACSGPETATETTVESMPEWMTEPPASDTYLLGSGTALSRALQPAIDKAETRARGDIASSIEVQFEGLTKDFQEEVSSELLEQFTQVQREVVNQVLIGTTVREQKVVEQSGRYRAYVLMQMPIGQASKELMARLRTNKALYTRFRATDAFEELNEAIEAYEEAQKTDAPQTPDRNSDSGTSNESGSDTGDADGDDPGANNS